MVRRLLLGRLQLELIPLVDPIHPTSSMYGQIGQQISMRWTHSDDLSLVQSAPRFLFMYLADILAFAMPQGAQELSASAAYEIAQPYHVFIHEISPPLCQMRYGRVRTRHRTDNFSLAWSAPWYLARHCKLHERASAFEVMVHISYTNRYKRLPPRKSLRLS